MALLAGNPWAPVQTTVSTVLMCTGDSKGWVFVECRHLGQTDRLMPLQSWDQELGAQSWLPSVLLYLV